MANFFTDNEDLQFYVNKGIDWEPLVAITEYDYQAPDGFKSAAEAVESYRDILDMVGTFVAEEIAPHAEEIDAKGVNYVDGEAIFPPRLQGIFDSIKELELHGMCLPRELGGMNCPLMLYLLNTEVMARADVSVMAHYGFHGGMAMAMLAFSIREGSTTFNLETKQIESTRFAEYIEEIRTGEAWGCMDITEPHAGSDMAALRAYGEQDEEGNWFVTGQKIFITSGHGKYHFVIARTEQSEDPNDPFAGLKGLSMFLVPAYEDDAEGNRTRIVEMDRIEEKMGHHGSVTASLNFDKAPAHLVGKRGEGFLYMLTLMNNARLGVGFESIGLCEAAYRMACDYAAERNSMGKSIDRHEMIADYLEEMRTDIQGLRALAMYGAWHEEMAQKIQIFLREELDSIRPESKKLRSQLKHHKAEARRTTPLLKYLAAEKAVELSRRCIQIHGGAGYIKEYGAEKLLRDAMVMPIYEGTSQIQALMAMKDKLMESIRSPQEFVSQMAQARWRSISSRNPLERRLAKLQSVAYSAQQHLITRTAADKFRGLQDKPLTSWPKAFFQNWNPKRDFSYAMLHAERFTRILSDVLICELLWEQAQKHPERTDVFIRYIERAEPRCRFLYDEILNTGQRLLERLEAERHNESSAAG